MPPDDRQLAGLLLLVWLTAVIAGCPTRRTGPDLPEMTDESSTVVRRIERTAQIREVMERDLDRATDLSKELAGISRDVFGGAFPLDLFKHVAVNCLNATAAETPDRGDRKTESFDDEGSGPPDLACKAQFLDRLLRRLDVQAPERQATAHGILRRVDQFHTLRKRLWRRIAKTSEILESNRELIASRRADLRKLRERWQERRQELSTARWNELQDRFDRYAERIDQLDTSTEQLRADSESWPERLDRANREMYLAITAHWERP